MSLTPREIGTLIVVILRAAHLPNKRNIGKQDPYCVVSVNGEKRRTKAIRRGGQHPEWDEEIRFTLFEDVEDVLDRTAHTDGTPPPPPPKDDIRGPKRIKGGKSMALACYADDPREPDLIGETTVDLTEVLTKGETDEWFTLSNKDKFAGKVYLELTFWSNEPPPEKKASTKPKANKEYLGPGSFTPAEDTPLQSSRAASTSNLHDHSRQSSDSIPASLRASNTLARLDLYVPPYERTSAPPADQLANDFSEFGMSDSHRRQSFPPPQRGYTPRSVSAGYSAYSPHPYESDPVYAYDRPVTPTHQSFLHHSNSINSHPSYSSPAAYQPQYETRSSALYHHSPTRGIPTSSSGFMPLSNSSGFVPLASHPSEGYSQSLSHTPAPIYNQSQFQPTTPYTPISSQTPIPANPLPYIPSSSSASFHSQQSFQPSQSFTYPQYDYSTPTPTPQPYITPQPPASIPTHIQTPAPTPTYQNYSTPSPPHNPTPPIPVPQNPLSSSLGAGSRPLPQQPQVVYVQQQIQPPYPPHRHHHH
ncbi:hypothetical protein BD779DRAFT_368600 [Infundibulicybe gibba]|nr:hypothetical protein BD779DRAFT_368600 [Infundibulicybe gibba]